MKVGTQIDPTLKPILGDRGKILRNRAGRFKEERKADWASFSSCDEVAKQLWDASLDLKSAPKAYLQKS